MRFRLGLVFGFLAGYVLGAKAGRQRYEQIRSWYQQVSGAAPVQEFTQQVQEVAQQATDTLADKATQKVDEAAAQAKDSLGNGGATSPSSTYR